jgi:hypothetical protein
MPRSSRIKVEKKDLNFEKFLGGPDKSGTQARQVHHTFSAATFDDRFERNLLTVSLIDYILLPLAS